MNAPDKKQRFNLSAWALEHQQLVSMFMMLILVAGCISVIKSSRVMKIRHLP